MDAAIKTVDGRFLSRYQRLSYLFDNEKVLGLLMIAPAMLYILALVGL
jgi:hypothetical protein